MLKKLLKLLRIASILRNNRTKKTIIIECLSTLACKCGRIYTSGKMLGDEITLAHKPSSNCPNCTRKYKLTAIDDRY